MIVEVNVSVIVEVNVSVIDAVIVNVHVPSAMFRPCVLVNAAAR